MHSWFCVVPHFPRFHVSCFVYTHLHKYGRSHTRRTLVDVGYYPIALPPYSTRHDLLKSYYLRTPSLTFEDKIIGRSSWAPGIYRVLETNPSVLTGWKKMAATARGKPDEMILSCHLLMALGTQQQWSCFGNWKPIHWSTSGNFENSCDLEQIREYIYKMVTITDLVRLF